MPVVEEPRVLPAEDGSATRGGGSRSDVGGLEEEPRARIRARVLGVVTPQIDLVRRCLGAKKSDNMGSYGVLTGADLKNVYLLSRFA